MSNKRIHPSPLLSSSSSSSLSSSSVYLSRLPTPLLALASTLTAQEQEVLSYLLDYGEPKNGKPDKNHPVNLDCSCFECYKSFWERWDSSPNRRIIHLILDEFEGNLEKRSWKKMNEAANGKKLVGTVINDDEVCTDDRQVCDVMGFSKKLFSWVLRN